MSLRFTVDMSNQSLQIDGVDISLTILKHLTQPSPPGVWFRIERDGDVVTIHQKLVKESD